jgi:hypothetical protein
MYTKLVGDFELERVWIFTSRMSLGSSLNQDLWGYARFPNIVILDQDNLDDMNLDFLKKVLVHEVTHLVVNPMLFDGNFANQDVWVYEGLAVFFSNYADMNYLNSTGYFIGTDSNEEYYIEQDIATTYTKEELIDRCKKRFHYVPSEDSDVYHFYIHSGMVFSNFHLLKGDKSIRDLIYKLSKLDIDDTDPECETCDREKIFSIMSDISGKQREELLRPCDDSPNFESLLDKLAVEEYTEEELDQILEDYKQSLIENDEEELQQEIVEKQTDVIEDSVAEEKDGVFTKIVNWFRDLFS